MAGKVKLALLLSFAWWACPPFFGRAVVNGQNHNSIGVTGEGAVAALPAETVTAPTGQFSSRNVAIAELDSLKLHLLDIEIEKAQERLNETSLWKRLIPQVHLSASLGLRDVVFIDQTTFTPYIIPRDAYRLTISFSLTGIFDFSKRSLARLEVEKLSTERSHTILKLAESRKILEQQLSALQEQLATLQKEMRIVQQLLRFNQMRFEQGKIEFDALLRTKLELLSVQKAVQRIQHQKAELQLKLSHGDVQ